MVEQRETSPSGSAPDGMGLFKNRREVGSRRLPGTTNQRGRQAQYPMLPLKGLVGGGPWWDEGNHSRGLHPGQTAYSMALGRQRKTDWDHTLYETSHGPLALR